MTAPLVTLSRLGRAALQYARRAWLLVPLHTAPQGRCSCGKSDCPSPGKHPRTSNGLLEATADLATVEGWWQRWPAANIGCRPGPSGFVVIDVDGPEGETAAQQLGLLAEPTLEVETGRADRGRHRWYRHPGGHISNAPLAPKLDVRADAGYVLLPPSIHPTGRAYRWHGRMDDVAALPDPIAARLRAASSPDAIKPRDGDQLPAYMIPWMDPEPGTRNTTMTRFVGWAFSKGHDVADTLSMALGLNAAWTSPLQRAEVEATVKSIAAKEARKPQRTTSTGQRLTMAEDVAPAAPKTFAETAWDQIDGAIARGRRDHHGAPRWRWRDLDRLAGPMLPGDLNVVGALTGNGKTSFLLSQMDAWASDRIPVLYVPLELDPEDLRRQWAAWSLGMDWTAVARNDWDSLPTGAQEQHEGELTRQLLNPFVHFPPDRRLSVATLTNYVAQAVKEIGARVVVVDHFHRMDFGAATDNYRVQVTEASRQLKDLAREHALVLVSAAQLNTDPSPLDRYHPPVLKRLKESAGLGEEANMVLMLSRRLRGAVTKEQRAGIQSGHTDVRGLEEPNLMVVTCRKARLEDSARDRAVFLDVRGGRVVDRAGYLFSSTI